MRESGCARERVCARAGVRLCARADVRESGCARDRAGRSGALGLNIHQKSVHVFIQRTFTSPGPWPLNLRKGQLLVNARVHWATTTQSRTKRICGCDGGLLMDEAARNPPPITDHLSEKQDLQRNRTYREAGLTEEQDFAP